MSIVSNQIKSSGTSSSRVLDFAIYVAIACAIGGGIIWFANRSDGTKNDNIARWGGLIVNSLILYGYFVKQSRPYWRAWGLWLAISSVLTIHILVFAAIFERVEHWKVGWFLLMYPIELPVLAIVSDWAIHVTSGKLR